MKQINFFVIYYNNPIRPSGVLRCTTAPGRIVTFRFTLRYRGTIGLKNTHDFKTSIKKLLATQGIQN